MSKFLFYQALIRQGANIKNAPQKRGASLATHGWKGLPLAFFPTGGWL
ncbi:MAG: hypothetical protein LUQ38_09875 [Methanotrichaceae archaeon]|nr:hypothetical protein [Methanotrichaceae archaeon]MDD1757338.1 hypothetical protein [Methanotrichaceae archaeon]